MHLTTDASCTTSSNRYTLLSDLLKIWNLLLDYKHTTGRGVSVYRNSWSSPKAHWLYPGTSIADAGEAGGGHRVGYQPRDGWWCRFLVPVFCKTHLVPGTKFRVVSCFFGLGAIFSLVSGTICMQKLGCNWHFISLSRIGCFVSGSKQRNRKNYAKTSISKTNKS